MAAIVERLAQICQAEGIEAEPEALMLLARRAAGSMRDSQSLLEQLLAFGDKRSRSSDVHRHARHGRLGANGAIVRHLAERDSTAALAELDAAVTRGRRCRPTARSVARLLPRPDGRRGRCPPRDALLYSSPGEHAELVESGRQLGMETILAMMQIIDQTIARLRYSMHPRTLAELALVRICTLEQLESLSAMVAGLKDGGAGSVGHAKSVAADGGRRLGRSLRPRRLQKKSGTR